MAFYGLFPQINPDSRYTIIRLRAGHAVAAEFGEAVRAGRVLRVEYLSRETLETAWQIFKAFGDKEFSFTDCTRFALMGRLQISAAFTFDEHFRQYGRFITHP
jgi:hypothetical protein